jgi:hypothetical protein
MCVTKDDDSRPAMIHWLIRHIAQNFFVLKETIRRIDKPAESMNGEREEGEWRLARTRGLG